MSCFSLGMIENLLIWAVIVIAIIMIIRLLDYREYISPKEQQKRMRELEVIRGILIAVPTIIVIGLALWMIPA